MVSEKKLEKIFEDAAFAAAESLAKTLNDSVDGLKGKKKVLSEKEAADLASHVIEPVFFAYLQTLVGFAAHVGFHKDDLIGSIEQFFEDLEEEESEPTSKEMN